MDVVVVTHWIHGEVREFIESFAVLRAPDEPGQVWDRERVVAEAAGARGLITSMADTVDEDLLNACGELRIVSATLKGYDNYDARACTRHGVWLSIVPDVIIAATAELTIALVLSLLRNVRSGDELVRGGRFGGWRPVLYGASLRGATVGIIGMGELGRAVSQMLTGFGIDRIVYVDEIDAASTGSSAPEGVRVDLQTLLSASDVVVVALPLTAGTHHLLDDAALAGLRGGSYLVNVGRGSVVDERAVLTALRDGRLSGYAADVFEMEDWALTDRPAVIATELRRHPRTLFTPHLGSAVDSVRREMSMIAARQVQQALAGLTPEHAVNRVESG